MNRLFRVGIRLHRPWPLILLMLFVVGIVGHSLEAYFTSWLALVVCIASIFLLLETSKRGGQLLAVINTVSERLKLYSCMPDRQTEPDRGTGPGRQTEKAEAKPAFEEQ